MHTLIWSTFDIAGGAARAAFRLHHGLQQAGLNSQMLVQYKSSDDRSVMGPSSKLDKWVGKLKPTLDDLPLKQYQGCNPHEFSLQWLPSFATAKVGQLRPDIVNLHWNSGYLRLENFAQLKVPLVWTLHDMWAFTGGCHYSQDCDRYQEACGACPQLNSDRDSDLSRWVWQRKARSWQKLSWTIVTPSQWLAQCARSSSLLKNARVEVIPNGLDLQRYKPAQRSIAREWLNLPQHKRLILFGAASPQDKRKGFYLLQQALQRLASVEDQPELVIFGALQSTPESLNLKTHYLGNLKDDISLALAYSAADVFVAPSLQDNLPNTIMEALACGTPCVSFAIGGMPDMIEHQRNGYLAQPFKIEDLAAGIEWVIADQQRHHSLCDRARKKVVQEFSVELQAQRYSTLFAEILEEHKGLTLQK